MITSLPQIGEVLVNGIIFDPKNGESLRTMNADELIRSIPQLFDLFDQRKVDYLLVGGIAMLAYVEGRNTQDIDLIISQSQLKQVPEIAIEDINPDFARGRFGQLRLDFLFAEHKLFNVIQKRYATHQVFADRKVVCASVEGLLLLKLFALPSLYRQGQRAKAGIYEQDIASLLGSYLNIDIEPLFKELSPHILASDLEELRRIVIEIQERIQRQQGRFGASE